MTDQQKQQITEMREKGIGYGVIASTLDMPISAVKSYCRRHVSAAPIQYAPDKSSGHRTQQIDIYYRFDVAVSTAVADSMKYDKKRKVA